MSGVGALLVHAAILCWRLTAVLLGVGVTL